MRNTNTRQRLEDLLSQLGGWKITVPDRARRFRAASLELEAQVQSALSFWSLLWISEEEVRRLVQRVERLAEIAEALPDLIRKTEALTADVGHVAENGQLEDLEVAAWLQDRCRDWLVVLARMAQNCERDSDLYRDEELYAETEIQVRRHREAVLQWREAERILAALRSDVRAASLASQLPQFRGRLFAEGATPEWLEQIKTLTQSLAHLVNPIAADPHPELGDINDVLAELRRWSDALGGKWEPEIQILRERQFKAIDWNSAEVREFGDEARALRTKLIDEAARLRTERLKAQGEELSDLRQAFGAVTDLQLGYGQLTGAVLTHPHEFREWQVEVERFRNSFLAVAQTHMGELQTRLYTTIGEIREELDNLAKRPLSAAVSQRVVLRRQEVDALPRVFDVEQILRQLRTVNAVAHDVQGLNRIADEELHEIERRQAELAERNERLQTEVRQLTALKINVPDLASRIATLSVVGTLEGSLEERQLHAGALEMELAELECRFMERCLQQLDSQRLDLQNAHRILQCAGVHPPDPEIDALPAGALPAAATRAVLQAKRRYQNFLKLAREVRQQLDARIERVTAEIAKILPEDLAPGDRQDAADLLAELEEGAWSRNPKRLERIERMTLVLEKCDLFVARLLQVERESRERLAELHRGFRQFSEEQLTGYCRQLAGRVRALLFGIPAHPRHWGLVQHQLEEAAVLFGRVDPQARRRAADELERAAEVLRRRVNSGFDRSGELVKLLSELEARGHESLPPVALRMRIVSASQRRI